MVQVFFPVLFVGGVLCRPRPATLFVFLFSCIVVVVGLLVGEEDWVFLLGCLFPVTARCLRYVLNMGIESVIESLTLSLTFGEVAPLLRTPSIELSEQLEVEIK